MHTCACPKCDFTLVIPDNLRQPNMISFALDQAKVKARFADGERILFNGDVIADVFLLILGDDGMLWRYSTAEASHYNEQGRHRCGTCEEDVCQEKLYGKVEFRRP